MYSIEPFALRGADQALCSQGGFRGVIAHQPLHGVMALTRRGELESGVPSDGFEHLVQRTSRHCRVGPHDEAFVDQAGHRAERFVASG